MICICGHKKEYHKDRKFKSKAEKFLSCICYGCINSNPFPIIPYHKFQLDNLGYLKSKYEAKVNLNGR